MELIRSTRQANCSATPTSRGWKNTDVTVTVSYSDNESFKE